MKLLFIIIAAAIVVGGGLWLLSRNKSNPVPAAQNSTIDQNASVQNVVVIKSFTFAPSTVSIKAGDSVTFKNEDSTTHTATSDNGVFDSGNIAPGSQYAQKFSTAGSFKYHCTIHSSMTGEIIVQ